MTRTLGLGCVVLVAIGGLYLAMTHFVRHGSGQSRSPSVRVAESVLRSGTERPGVEVQPGSHDTDGYPRSSLERAWPASDKQPQSPAEASLPTTVEEALESNPKLAEDLACRDSQARFNMDYDLRMVAGIRDCLAGKTHSRGRFEFVLFFDNDPITRKSTGTGLEPRRSELSPEDDKVVFECLNAYVVGSVLLASEKYGQGTKQYRGDRISLPLEDSGVYMQVRDGTYTPGYEGCDYP